MAPRGADGDNRDLHCGPGHGAGCHAVAHTRIRDAGVTHEGDPCRKGPSQDVGCLENPSRKRRAQQLEGVEARQTCVNVTVKNTGQHPKSIAIEPDPARAWR